MLVLRLLASAFLIAVYTVLDIAMTPQAMIATGQAAGRQLLPSDGEFINSFYTFQMWKGATGLLSLVLFVLLVALWAGPLYRMIMKVVNTNTISCLLMLFMATVLLGCSNQPAKAYWDNKDVTEAYTIGPNETAIIVPSVGNNTDSQVQMNSEAYLKSKQVASKMVVIPHAKLKDSAYWGWDYYVPTARLFIVDRSTFSHEWVGAGRGTNPKLDESIPCQSKEGLNIKVGVSVGVNVKEEDAAKFLYNFGIEPLPHGTNRSDPQIIFRSVYYSRKVSDVMEDVGRKAIQTFVCNEISSRTFDQDNADAAKIMDTVKQKATTFLASVGINLVFIGWADTFSFDPEVQKAVNDKYVAETLGPMLGVMTQIANLKVQEGLGSGLDKHGLPIVVTPEMLQTLTGLAAKVGPSVPATIVPAK